MVSVTINAPRKFPRNTNRMTETRMMPSVKLCSTVCVVSLHQVAAIQMRDDLHSRRQKMVVEKIDFLMQRHPARRRASAPLRSSTIPETTSGLSITLPGSGCIAFPTCPSRIFGPCSDARDVAHSHRNAVLRLEHRRSISLLVFDQSHRAHIDRLLAALDETAAGVDVVVGQRLSPPGRYSIRKRSAYWDRHSPDTRAWCRQKPQRRSHPARTSTAWSAPNPAATSDSSRHRQDSCSPA